MTKQTDMMLHESPHNRRVATAAAKVSNLRNPTVKSMRVGVSHDGATISATFDDTLTGRRPQGFFLRVENGPGRVDLTRSRTVWIGIVPALP